MVSQAFATTCWSTMISPYVRILCKAKQMSRLVSSISPPPDSAGPEMAYQSPFHEDNRSPLEQSMKPSLWPCNHCQAASDKQPTVDISALACTSSRATQLETLSHLKRFAHSATNHHVVGHRAQSRPAVRNICSTGRMMYEQEQCLITVCMKPYLISS